MATRKDKQPLSECDSYIKEIRSHLTDQVKCLDQQHDSRVNLLNDIQDFFKRKSEVESEYAKKLDVLSEKFFTKHKNLFAQRKDQTDQNVLSSMSCWMQMLEQCHRESKDHNAISNMYSLQLLPRLQIIAEDQFRQHKKNRDITSKTQEGLLEDLRKLYQALQDYQTYWGEYVQAESKFRQIEKQLEKRNEKINDASKDDQKLRRSNSLRKLDKSYDKRKMKYSEAKLKCVKARNEYILQLEAANATLNKYYDSDMENLLDIASLGYHNSLQRMWNVYWEGESAAQASRQTGLSFLKKCVDCLDPEADKQKYLGSHSTAFNVPLPFAFMGPVEDEVKKVSVTHSQLHKEAEKRCNEMEQTVTKMIEEQNELKSILSSSLIMMSQLSSSFTCEMTSSFLHGNRGAESPASQPVPPFISKEFTKTRGNLVDVDNRYIEKMEDFIQKGNQLNRLEARCKLLAKALLEDPSANDDIDAVMSSLSPTSSSSKKSPPGRKLGRKTTTAENVLNHFSNNLQKYLQDSGRAIPLLVESCIRVINLYGLHHQGIFRVPGSHQEMQEMKSLYEKGQNPVLEQDDKADINTVSGLLKLYFRELEEKLFPQFLFDELMKCAHVTNIDEKVAMITQVLSIVAPPVLVVMRYLFAFLHHLSENSDENMMDAYNIAVCFGPTLLPVPDGYDQVTTQANVNEIIKTIVVNHETIFSADLKGPVYEKMMSSEGISPTEASQDNPDAGGQSSASDDESEHIQDATAMHDYKGRSDRELSFSKGDLITLYKQASEAWWEGSVKGRDGLVPSAYISVHDSTIEERPETDTISEPPSPAPVHRTIPNIPTIIQPMDRKTAGELSRRPDPSRASQKTRSLDRYNNVQDYMRQQKAIADIATKAAQHGLARSEMVSSKRASSLRRDKAPVEDSENDVPTVDPMSLSVQQKIAQFRRSTKGPKGGDQDITDAKTPEEGEKHFPPVRKSSLDSYSSSDIPGRDGKPHPDIAIKPARFGKNTNNNNSIETSTYLASRNLC